MLRQVIEAFPHGEVKQPKRVCSHKVKMRAEIVSVLGLVELAEPRPFEAQGENATLGEVDAALLLVLRSFAFGVMTVHVQDRRGFAAGLLRLVENAGGLESGHDFKPKLPHAITLPRLHRADVLELQWRLSPLPRPSVKGDVPKDVPAQALRFGGPPIGALRRGQCWNLGCQVLAQLKRGDGRDLNLLLEDGADLPRRRLSARERRVQDCEKKRCLYHRTDSHDPSRLSGSQQLPIRTN